MSRRRNPRSVHPLGTWWKIQSVEPTIWCFETSLSDIFHQVETHPMTICDPLTFSNWQKLTIGLLMTVLHFPSMKTNQWGFFTTVWHFPSNRNSKMDFLWPSDIFHHMETLHWIFCDRLTFSNKEKPVVSNIPLQRIRSSQIFQMK